MLVALKNPASFRDPAGHVFEADGRIFRTVNASAVAGYQSVVATGLLRSLEEEQLVVRSSTVDAAEIAGFDTGAALVLEHPRIPFICYPYEWPFSLLKAAALLHLDIQLRALQKGVMLIDASAFNVQFVGCRPRFIDVLSFRPYQEGQLWSGHRQFCEQFLAPLLLQHYCGISHNAWMRGSMRGIGVEELHRVLPLSCMFSLRVLLHVTLPARWQARAARQGSAARIESGKRSLPRAGLVALLQQLRNWIEDLEPRVGQSDVFWGSYAASPGYSAREHEIKRDFVARYAQAVKPVSLWDLGANTGEYSEVALRSGAQSVVAFDAESAVVDAAARRAMANNLNLLPLVMDATDPSPSQGWRGVERQSLSARGGADGVLALAFLHHLAIGQNIPLEDAVDWLVGVAPTGVIEFVPKADPTVRRMLALREDIFPGYSSDAFVAVLAARSRIVDRVVVSDSGRELFRYSRE